eukprot:5662852-Ditylum_brightwellii.AAC.1
MVLIIIIHHEEDVMARDILLMMLIVIIHHEEDEIGRGRYDYDECGHPYNHEALFGMQVQMQEQLMAST